MTHSLESELPAEIRAYSPEEVLKHNVSTDLWIIIDREVYDLSGFIDEHPGGPKILLPVAGKDATKQFRRYHRDAILNRFKDRLRVGTLDSHEKTRKKSLFGFSFRGSKKE